MRKEQPGATVKTLQKVTLSPYQIAKFASNLEPKAFGEFLHELGILFSHWGDSQTVFLTQALTHCRDMLEETDLSQFQSGEEHAYGIELVELMREAASYAEFDVLVEELEKRTDGGGKAKWLP